jgi:histidine phosphotransferase ChpT
MDDPDSLVLAQSLCTRLCHDLSGPLGAIGSGAELLQDEAGTPDPQIIALLTDSAGSAATRLRFLRALLGLPSGRGLDPEDARALLSDHLAATSAPRVPALTWEVTPGGDTEGARAFVQGLLNLCLLGLEALPRHEHLAVTAPGADRAEVRVTGSSDARPAPLAALEAGLAGGPLPDDPRAIHAHYTGLLARGLGLRVEAERAPGLLRLAVFPHD